MEPNVVNSIPDMYGDPIQKGFSNKLKDYLVEFIETIVVVGAIFAAIYLFIAQFHKVSGNSMVPTYHHGDYLITEKVSYRFREPERGEVVVLKNPRNEAEDFIKRIIAIPGDTLQISGGSIYLNGQLLKEPYLPPDILTPDGAFITEGQVVTVDTNQYYVIGDNRGHSSDSREWGPVTKKEIRGRAFFRYFPPQAIGLLTSK